jgi:hypothetical protein
MGGSSGGGGSSGANTFEREQKNLLRQQAGISSQIQGMATSGNVAALAGSGLTENELMAMQSQLGAIGAGREQAQQGIQQNVRTEATSRGLFSSAGAIGQEAGQLAGLDTFEAMQRANILGQTYQGAQQRQFQGIGLQQGLLGQAAGVAGGAQQGYAGLGNQNMQMDQMDQQRRQQGQAQQMKGIQSAVGLGMMFVPGMQGAGASMLGSSMR